MHAYIAMAGAIAVLVASSAFCEEALEGFGAISRGGDGGLIAISFVPGPDSVSEDGCVVIEDPVLGDAASRVYVSGNRGPFIFGRTSTGSSG